MPHRKDNHVTQKNTSQAMSESGKATSRPRAKLPLPLATVTSPPKLADNSFIPMDSSKRATPMILSNSSRCKSRAPPGRGRRGVVDQFAVSLGRALGDLPIIVCLSLEALMVKRDVKLRAIRIKPLAGQVRVKPKTLSPIAVLALLLLSRPALAQGDDKVVTPIELFEPERGEGFRIAPSLKAYPALEADVTYDSNIYNNSGLATDDLVGSLRPRLALRPSASVRRRTIPTCLPSRPPSSTSGCPG